MAKLWYSGAVDAAGRTSWTGRPELADYVSFYGFMFLYLHLLKSGGLKPGSIPDSNDDDIPGPACGHKSAAVHITLSGYSYGSLMTSNLPKLDAIVELFKSSTDEAPFNDLIRTAKEIYQGSEDGNSAPQRQTPSSGNCRPRDCEALHDTTTTTISYLLISPLLPPINLFLTMFSKLFLDVGEQGLRKGMQISCPKPADQLSVHPTLVIYGNRDTFTSAHKLRKWSEDLMRIPGSRFRSVEVDGAGHFWREMGAESQARNALRTWLGQIA
ncbi:hypothetical protein FE257_008370 [Aspergillus nanangensis]|uniref:Uncharacterized protein n=1 Tax=Aspergillus nanangensis TaxID=2582783 RepID=A0AAD4GSS1_ASPNN|nr:hypothetical protein FE257_008370 [Aspergillus nanangensis]